MCRHPREPARAAVTGAKTVLGRPRRCVMGSRPGASERWLQTNIGNVATLNDAVTAFNSTERISGQTKIRIRA